MSSTLVPSLPPDSQDFLRGLALHYRLSEKEIRWLVQVARDLEMWRETPLALWWKRSEKEVDDGGLPHLERLLHHLRAHMERLCGNKTYPSRPLAGLQRPKDSVVHHEAPGQLFGRCPNYSDEALCCGLLSMDAVIGCPFGCSYCPVKTYLGNKIEIATDAAERIKEVRLPPNQFHHIGTGHASDLLLLGNRHGLMDAVCDLATLHPNALVELRTKSDQFNYRRKKRLPDNVICSWSLNTETISRNEEQRTAPLNGRLQAARRAVASGRKVAFHIHPLVQYRGWHGEYASLASRLLAEFSPEDVAFISMAAMSLTPGVIRDIRRLGGESKVLQMPMVNDSAGNFVYPESLKIELFRLVYGTLRPWHGKVFIYLCGETPSVWKQVVSRTYAGTEDFQLDLAHNVAAKVPGLQVVQDGLVSRTGHSRRPW